MRRVVLGALAIAAASACTPAPAPTTEPPPAPVEDLGLRQHVGQRFETFTQSVGMARFAPSRLGLNEADQTRLVVDMAVTQPSVLAQGGGASALLFTGCATTGCADGMGLVAIDVASGAVFIGVRDAHGRDVLLPNDRLEALLEATSATRQWDTAGTAPPPAAP